MFLLLALVLVCVGIVRCDYTIWSGHIGGQGGGYFYNSKSYAGLAISKFEVWQGGWQLRGIRVTYTDGSQSTMGALEDKYTSFELDYTNGERVNYLSLYGNGEGSRCGAFRIKTNKGRDFFPQMYDWGLKDEYVQNAGGGVVLGIFGKGGSDIDSLGFVMIRPIRSMILMNVNYDMSVIAIPTRKTVYEIDIPNPSDTDSNHGSIQKSMSETRSYTWSVSATVTFGQTYSVSAGIPEVAEVGSSTTWEISTTASYSSTHSETLSDIVTIPLICPARTKTKIWYFYYTGTADITMTGTMRIITDDNSVWTYSVSGTYKGVDSTRIIGDSILLANWINNEWVDAASDDVPIINIVPIRLFDRPLPLKPYVPNDFIVNFDYYIKIGIALCVLIISLLFVSTSFSISMWWKNKDENKFKYASFDKHNMDQDEDDE